MKIVMLCGGQGMRLREETEFRPKPMLEIGGRPILWHIMKIYATFGYDDFVLCLGYRGNVIKEYFLNYEAMNNDFTICLGGKHEIDFQSAHGEQDFRVTLVDTGLPTNTGGRIKRVARYLDADSFMVTYGDGVADIDIQRLLAFHKAHGRLATLTTVRPYSRFGVLNLDDSGQVLNFAEKPQVDGWVNAGFFVFERRILDYLGGDESILETDALFQLARQGQLMAYRHDGFFYAMDTYREYRYLNDLWERGEAPWRIWE
jgi:glucose-1-phosphate cytidylyltransferase